MSAAPSPFDPVEASLADRLQAVREARELAARLRDLTAAHPDLRPAVLDTLGGTVPVPVTTPEPAPPPPAEPAARLRRQAPAGSDNTQFMRTVVPVRVQPYCGSYSSQSTGIPREPARRRSGGASGAQRRS